MQKGFDCRFEIEGSTVESMVGAIGDGGKGRDGEKGD